MFRGLGNPDLIEHVALAANRMGRRADESTHLGFDDHAITPEAFRKTGMVPKAGGHALP